MLPNLLLALVSALFVGGNFGRKNGYKTFITSEETQVSPHSIILSPQGVCFAELKVVRKLST